MKAQALLMIFVLLLTSVGAFAQTAQDFVLAVAGTELVLDPHHAYSASEAQLFTAVYEGLFTYDPGTLEPVKAACSRSEKSADGKTWTFYLRKDAKWSNGEKLTASDFRNAWLRILSPSEKAEYSSLFDAIAGAKAFRTGKSKDEKSLGITVISEEVLQVRLEYPLSFFTRLLCHHSFSPVHKSMIGQGKNWEKASSIPCNGPFVYASSDKTGIVMKRNPHYWDNGSTRITSVTAKFTESADDVTRAFNSGDIHWLSGDFEYELLADQATVEMNPLFASNYWYFNCAKPPFNDPLLRRALALLVPWDQIRTTDSYISPANTLILPIQGYPEAKGIRKADRDEAIKTLEKAGFGNHADVPEITILIPSTDDPKRLAGIMKTAWETEGFKVTVKEVKPERFFQSSKQTDFTVTSLSWIGDYADPHTFLQMWQKDSNLNDAGFSDAEFDRLMEESNKLEGKARYEILGKAESILLDTGTVMPIYHSPALNVIDTRVIEGWYPNVLDIHPFKYLFIGEPEAGPGVVGKNAFRDMASR